MTTPSSSTITLAMMRQSLSSALVCDALDAEGLRHQSPRVPLRSLTVDGLLVGRCRTMLWTDMAHVDPRPYELELRAVDSCQPDDVLIAAAGGSMRSGIWGELLSTAARNSGCVGAIVDGAVRDVRQMRQMSFAVFGRGTCPYDSLNRQRVIDLDVPVEIDGVRFVPGDLVLADEDGVVVVPRAVEEAVMRRAWEKAHAENVTRDAIRAGLKAAVVFARYGILQTALRHATLQRVQLGRLEDTAMCISRRAWIALALALALLGWLAVPLPAAAQEKMGVLLDTDLGSDIGDAFALALLLKSPEVELRGITTVGGDAEMRARMVGRFLTAVGRKDIAVAWGRAPQPATELDWQIQYGRHPAVVFNRTLKPVKEPAVDFLYAQLKANPGKLTILATGPLTNLGQLLSTHPDCQAWIKRIVVSGGVAYDQGKPLVRDANLAADVKAAQSVIDSGIPLTIVPASAAAAVRLDEKLRQQLFQGCTAVTLQAQSLYQLWDRSTPVLADAVAAMLTFDEAFCKMVRNTGMAVNKDGTLRLVEGKSNHTVLQSVAAADFLKWYVAHVSAGTAVLPKAPPNPAKPMPHDGFPNRVHAFEDYVTDIEKRWWMSGKLETAHVPPGSVRACRGVLTQDFDDRQGDMQTMYTAVIFNPVPGPPMGKQPRLRFRYWLKGTDTLRVQIYSLTKGYHRCLTLTGLPQEKWHTATVDMTQVLRPDGSGGPLAENERIDDIQFYVDPRAELVIGDMILYDAPVAGEKRPFPQRLLFTGIFDTGKQGKEWPGTFDIVDKGYFWKAAKSVPRPPEGAWIRLHLRGERPLGATTHVTFRYHATGAKELSVVLVSRTNKDTHVVKLTPLQQGAWAEATVDFTSAALGSNGKNVPPALGDRVEEIHFLLPAGAELLLDDVLLYEPGK